MTERWMIEDRLRALEGKALLDAKDDNDTEVDPTFLLWMIDVVHAYRVEHGLEKKQNDRLPF